MRENRQDTSASWVEDEMPRPSVPVKPLMLDKETDTSLDEESFKLVPCSCISPNVESNTSFANQISYHGLGPKATLRECLCAEQKGKTLLNAVFTGNSELLAICLDIGVDVNSVDENGDTALHMVSDRGDVEMLSFFLRMDDVNVNAQNFMGLTPLSVAIISSRDAAAELLLEHGADPNIPDIHGRTPIFFSVQHGNEGITKKLIDHNAVVNVVDIFGGCPLQHVLTDNPLLTMVQILLSSGANPLQKTHRLNPFLETVLACTSNQQLELVKLLVEYGVNVNVIEPYSQRNCLHLTAINGFMPLAEYLVRAGADLEQFDTSGRSPDVVAKEENNLSVADFFLKAKLLRRIFFKEKLKRMNRPPNREIISPMFSSSTDLKVP